MNSQLWHLFLWLRHAVGFPGRLFLFSAVLRGSNYPGVVFLLLLGIVLYQLISGRLLGLTWRVWFSRAEKPGAYWAVIIIETVAAVAGLCLWALSLRIRVSD